MNLSSGRIWPYVIGGSITAIFGACVATVVVASTLPVAKSDAYMMDYQEADAHANEIIKAQIEFDKRYKIEYINNGLDIDNSQIVYKIFDKEGKAVNNAKIEFVITRPNTQKYDQKFISENSGNGIYSVDKISLPKEGRWDIMAKIDIKEHYRFYNIKADTRDLKIKEL